MVLVITFIEPRKELQPPTAERGPRTSVAKPAEKSICHIILLSPNDHALSLTSLRWIKSLLYYKNGKEEYSK